ELGMFVSQVVQGRWLRAEDVEVIRCLIGEHPHWSRRRLSVAVSGAFNWRTASGQLKDMSARLLLAKLAERGIVKLPPRQRRGGGRPLRALSRALLGRWQWPGADRRSAGGSSVLSLKSVTITEFLLCHREMARPILQLQAT